MDGGRGEGRAQTAVGPRSCKKLVAAGLAPGYRRRPIDRGSTPWPRPAFLPNPHPLPDMRKFALIVLLAFLLGACRNFTWQNRAGMSPEARQMGLQDVSTLATEYANERKWRDVRRIMDGRTNALARDFASFWAVIDRHFFNYSPTDPYVNFETDENFYSTTVHSLGAGVSTNVMPWFPGR